MAKTVACVIARTVSTRLPMKVLRTVDGKHSMLDFMFRRLKKVSDLDAIYLCTSTEVVDDILEDVAEKNRVSIYRGSADAVIERIIAVGEKEAADNVIRITGDNVFTATERLGEQISIHQNNSMDYTRYVGLPIGATAEVMSLRAVKDCYENIDPSISEYLMLYMFDPQKYKCAVVERKGAEDFSRYTLTVDTSADLVRTRDILKKLNCEPEQVDLDKIMSLVIEGCVPFSTLSNEAVIKMPYGESTSFGEFLQQMRLRAQRSNRFEL